MTDQEQGTTTTKKPGKPKTVAIKNTMPAGKLFHTLGILRAGETGEVPAKEAARFVKCGKAAIPFPDDET